MRILRTRFQFQSILSSCILTLAVTACGGKQEAPPTTPTPIASTSATATATTSPMAVAAPEATPATVPSSVAAPAPEEHQGRKPHHPMVAMVFAELPQVGLSAQQKTTVDSIEAELEKQSEVIDAPKKQFDADVADSAAAGKIDKTKVDADVQKLVQAADSTVVSMQSAINKLHETLDAAQRKKLVKLLRAKGGEHREHAKGGKPGSGSAEQGKPGNGRTEKLAAELGLTAEQREKLTTKLGAELKAEQSNLKQLAVNMKKSMQAVLYAFTSDMFDAKKAGVGERVGDMVKMMAQGRVRFVETVLSVLTPEQRNKFVEHLRRHAEERE